MADRLISIDTAQAAGEQLPSVVVAEIIAALFTDNGDGTWSAG